LDHRRLVDLLLVRLTRDEEKGKVTELLISELGMSREEAIEKVDNSPCILSEGIDMEQGRIMQNRLYPFLDLLPRHYEGNSAGPKIPKDDPDESEYEMITDDIPAIEEKNKEDKGDSALPDDDLYHAQSAVSEEQHVHKSFDDDDDDSLIITSASDEMLSIERCHICGRTPSSDQKLVPCRTCRKLTCSDCFNREHHVCEKCATEGRAVDRPLDSVPVSARGIGVKEPQKAEAKVSTAGRSKSARSGLLLGISPTVIIATAVVLVLVAFFLIDPINLFSSEDNGSAGTLNATTDTLTTVHADSQVVIDTTVTSQDSLNADSLEVLTYLSLRDISLPDSLEAPAEYSLPPVLSESPVAGIEIQIDSMPFLAVPVGQLAAHNSIEFDGISLIRTEDGFNIFLMSILHPEPAEKRAALLGSIGSMLDSTIVDQRVLYYRENQYYEANLFSFTADSFNVLSRSISPNFLQRKQAVIPETTELITGRLFDWMTDIN